MSFLRRFRAGSTVFLATGFGAGIAAGYLSGFLRRRVRFPFPERWTGAGLVGTLMAAVLCYFGIGFFRGWNGFFVLAAFSLLSVFIASSAGGIFRKKDDPRIIIDEIAGFFWAVAGVPLVFSHRIETLSAAVILFRLFDVFKIPSRKAEDLPGGWGVVCDDVLAGCAVNLLFRAVVPFMTK